MPWGRETNWRQGRALTRESFCALGLDEVGDDLTIALAVSHDCDIANADIEKEPFVEFVLGRYVDTRNGQFENAKNLRILQIQAQADGAGRTVELLAFRKIPIHKNDLSEHEPDDGFIIEDRCHSVLCDWLAARYKRHAFPDSFNNRIAPIAGALEKAGKKHVQGVLGYWLDYQPRDIELPKDAPYELSLLIIYSGDDLAYEGQAEEIAETIKDNFDELMKKSAEEGEIELIRCKAYSEYEFTLNDMREYIQYRFEHLSYRQEPPGPVV